ncbi:MAG: SDR family oxidoreductase [Patescibacteria group bacterium]
MPQNILVIGGAGYVGSALVPKLLDKGHFVRVLDTFWFGVGVFNEWLSRYGLTDNLELIEGDIRNYDLKEAMTNIDCIIHLACISNDPSFELNPELGRSINYDAFLRVIKAAQEEKIKRFIFASTSSVYGVKREENVTENLALEPLTDYSKYKAFCEMELRMIPADKLPWVIIRPATVCGYAPRLRLDLTVNALTISALTKNKITVFGGAQKRPNIHIDDIADLYVRLVDEYDDEKIVGNIFNAGGNNLSIMGIALIVQSVIKEIKKTEVEIEVSPSNDFRSYRISCEKIKNALGWQTQYTVSDAIRDLIKAYDDGKIPDPDNARYHNIKTMQNLNIR